MQLLFPFDEDYLSKALDEVCSLFLPEFSTQDVKIVVGKGKYCVAAATHIQTKTIFMFPAYHYRFPDEYKSTLLHEMGHLLFTPYHDSKFYQYYLMLKERQDVLSKLRGKSSAFDTLLPQIDDPVIPQDYDDFLYAKPARNYKYRYVCSSCRLYVLRKNKMSVERYPVCSECSTKMLLVNP